MPIGQISTAISRAVRVLLLSCLVLCGLSELASAQMLTGNKFVTASVDPLSGKVNIRTTDGKPLTFDNMSFLTVQVNDRIWTNNDQVTFDSRNPQYGGILNNGQSKQIWDTIRTVWKVSTGEIIQDVYPVAFDFSGQIVLHWKFHSLTYDMNTLRMQYLLDTRINGNDQARVLTRYGYRNTWTLYADGNPNYDPIPSFYQAFQFDLDEAHSYNPGVVSQGNFINPDLMLMKPDAVVVGDWTVLSLMLWGWPNNMGSLGTYDDSAILMQFAQTYATSAGTVDIGKTSYGTGEFETCTGALYGLIFRPRLLHPDATGTGYTPNPFTVDVFLFNTNKYTEANYTQATLKVGNHLTILDSGAINGGKELTQWATPKITPVGSVSAVSWHVYADKTCDPDTTFLELSAKCNLADPSFSAPCLLPVTLPCLDRDTLPPVSYPEVSNGFVRQMAFDDNRPKDRGIDKVEILPYDVAHFRVTVSPFAQCTHDKVWITATQLDSTIDGCIDIRVTDCAGNSTVDEICFPKYPLHPDTIAPRLTIVDQRETYDGSLCNMKYDSILAVDDTTYDLGLKSIEITPTTTPVNIALDTQSFPMGATRQGFAVHVLDSMVDGWISVRVTDMAGNYTDTVIRYCTIPDLHPPELTVIQSGPYEWSVLATEQHPYDRGLDTIDVHDRVNVQLSRSNLDFEPTRALTRDQKTFAFKVVVIDTNEPASFCVRVKDLADSMTADINNADWWSHDTCLSRSPGVDVWAPNIVLTPSPLRSPTTITAFVDDIHYYSPSLQIGWDKGIDKVWFDPVDGYIVPDTIYGHCEKQLPPFELKVADSTAIKVISSVCIHALDCAGNQTDTCLMYPVKPDSLAPFIYGRSASRAQVDLTVTDSNLYDRGLRDIELVDRQNFDVFEKQVPSSKMEVAPLALTNPKQSGTAKLVATDLWGVADGIAADSALHTTTADVAIWVQDLAMKVHTLAKQDEDIRVPVVIPVTDTFALARKGITSFQFSVDLVGDPNFTYVGVDTKGYATDGWNVTGNEIARRVTITGRSQTGAPLSQQDTLLTLIIHSGADESTRQVTLTPVTVNGASVMYNDGADVTVQQSAHASVIMPPPFGGISGATIVAQGSCSPSITSTGIQPSVAMIGTIRPNPVTREATVSYGLANDGYATLIIYDDLGREVTRLLSSDELAGYYTTTFNASGLASGQYYIRLQSGPEVATRTIVVGR